MQVSCLERGRDGASLTVTQVAEKDQVRLGDRSWHLLLEIPPGQRGHLLPGGGRRHSGGHQCAQSGGGRGGGGHQEVQEGAGGPGLFI